MTDSCSSRAVNTRPNPEPCRPQDLGKFEILTKRWSRPNRTFTY